VIGDPLEGKALAVRISISRHADASEIALRACAELIYGDGTAKSQQQAIDLARQALALLPVAS
jgi:hypothetical protein